MTPRNSLLILLVVVPVLARGGGRGGGGGGHGSSHGSYGGGHGSYGGGHTYPSSTGYSGHGTGHTTHTQSATYPHSTGLSGHGSGATHTNTYVKEVHHHHYTPPQQIHYGSGYHPVYHERPPVYVYTYRDSGSRFDTLLTGLALYNLGRMSSHHDHSYYQSHSEYRGSPGEMCKMQINKANGEMEETRIDCKLMSSFIWDAQREQETERNRVISTNTVTTVTKTETTNTSNNASTVTTTTVQDKTVVDALEAKGPSIKVTDGMSCFMIRTSNRDALYVKKKVDCGLLQVYAVNSFSSSIRNVPVFATVILLSSIVYLTQ